MLWTRTLLLYVLMLLPAFAQDDGAARFNGSWAVEYVDLEIGRVTGRSVIDVDAQTAVVTYQHPKTGEEFRLESDSFERDGDTLRIRLTGRGPAAPANDGLNYPVTSIIVPQQTPDVSAKLNQDSHDITLAPRALSDRDTIDLELTLTDPKHLQGRWSYTADPFTRRAFDGLGRIGNVEWQTDGSARQTGSEVWTRPEPKIVTSFALNPQLGWNLDLNMPNRPYPFGDDGLARDSIERVIVIAGYDFPVLDTDPVLLKSLNPAISYGRLIDARSTFQYIGGHQDPIAVARSRIAGEHSATMGATQARIYAEEMDYLIVRATIRKSGVDADGKDQLTVPGMQRFELNGSAAAWHLAFGNNGAQIRFVRSIDPAVVPERRFDTFNLVVRKPDNTLSHRALKIEINDLIGTGQVAPQSPQWVTSGDELKGDIWSAATYTTDLDITGRALEKPVDIALMMVLSDDLRDKLEKSMQTRVETASPQGEVLEPGTYRAAHGTLVIEDTGKFSYRADPVAWSAPGYEATPHLFAPEVFRIAVRTELALPRDEINVVLGLRKKLIKFGKKENIVVRRHATDPRLYLSDPIFLPLPENGDGAAPQGTMPIKATVEDRTTLYATIADPGLISVLPGPAKAFVRASPGSMEVVQTHSNTDLIGTLRSFRWLDHLRTAHACYDDVEPVDWDQSNYDFVATIEQDLNFAWWKVVSPAFLLFSSETLTTDFQLGDHAALLLLRQAFEASLDPRVVEYRRLANRADNEEVAAFWISLNPYRRHGRGANHPLNNITYDINVPMADGTEDLFLFTYSYNASSSDRIVEFDDPRQVPLWIVSATRNALTQYADAMEESLTTAIETDACDVEALVKIVGANFDNVVDQLMPRLMMLHDEQARIWQPDYHGRLRIAQVASKLWQVRAHQRLSEEDTEHVLFYGSLVTLPVGGVGATAAAAMMAINAGTYVYFEYPKYAESQEELAFARGAAESLGLERFLTADARQYRTEEFVGGLAMTAIGEFAGADFVATFGKAGREVASTVARGLELLTTLRNSDIADTIRRSAVGWRYLAVRRGANMVNADDFDLSRVVSRRSGRDAADLGEFLFFVLAREAAGETLDPAHRRALAKLKLLQLENPAEAFTGELQVLADIARQRPDLVRLVANSGDQVAARLAAGGRMREQALILLRNFPQDDFARFDRALLQRLRRVRDPLGESFFNLADPQNRNVVELLEYNGWDISVTQATGPNEYQVRLARGKRFSDTMHFGFDPSTGTVSFNGAFRNEVPGRLSFDLPESMQGRRMPTFLLAQMRFLHHMNIGYAAQAGEAIRRVKLNWVLNARTNAHLTWYRNTYYPGYSFAQLQSEGLLEDFLRHTRVVEFSETFLNMAGYEIKAARAEFLGGEYRIGGMRSTFARAADGESWSEFLRRHSLQQTAPSPPNFHIYLDIEPHHRAFRNTALEETGIFDIPMPPDVPTVTLRRPSATNVPQPPQTGAGTAGISIREGTRRRDIRMMAVWDVTEEAASNYAEQMASRPVPQRATREMVRGQVAAEAIMQDGSRTVSFEEFMEATKLDKRAARWAAKQAAKRLKTVVLPGEIRPMHMLPPDYQ